MRKLHLYILMFLTVTTFTNCSREFYEAPTNPVEGKDYVINKKTFDELKHDKIFVETFEQAQRTAVSKGMTLRGDSEMYGFRIDSTEINEVIAGLYKSYSIGIIPDTLDSASFKNLFIEFNDADIKISVLKYHVDAEERVISFEPETIKDFDEQAGEESRCTTIYISFCVPCGCDQHGCSEMGDCICGLPPLLIEEMFTHCSTGGHGGGGGSGPGGIAAPNAVTAAKLRQKYFFISQLSDVQYTQYNGLDEDIKGEILTYLENAVNPLGLITYATQYPQEAVTMVISMIDFIHQNNGMPTATEEISHIFDILQNGSVNGEPILLAPNDPIDDMADFLSCFDFSQDATITLYADQPVTGTNHLIGPNTNVGHAFISIKQGNHVASLGFYPNCTPCSVLPNPLTLNPLDFMPVPGVFGNDEGHSFDVSITLSITAPQLADLISIIIAASNNPVYNLASNNCTDLAVSFFETAATNLDIPDAESPSPWSGQTPGTLGEILRDISLPAGGIKNEDGGNAPTNNCN